MTVKSVSRFNLSGMRRVTVHRAETGVLKEYDHKDISGAAIMGSELPMNKLAEKLFALPKVVMVEVIDRGGVGIRLEK